MNETPHNELFIYFFQLFFFTPDDANCENLWKLGPTKNCFPVELLNKKYEPRKSLISINQTMNDKITKNYNQYNGT